MRFHPLAVTAKTSLSGFPDSPFDVNVASFGLGALWAAAGDTVRLNPTTLAELGAWSAVLGLTTAKPGAWVSAMNLNHRTPTATITLYKGAKLARGAQVHYPTQGAATVAYVAGHVLWLIDGRGATKTMCASRATGRIRATGSAGVASEGGAMSTVKGLAFLLAPGVPLRLLEIQSASACTS